MKNIPVTNEYALEKIKIALSKGNIKEADKWKLCIQSNNDLRIRVKQRMRYFKELNIQVRLKEMYRTPLSTNNK